MIVYVLAVLSAVSNATAVYEENPVPGIVVENTDAVPFPARLAMNSSIWSAFPASILPPKPAGPHFSLSRHMERGMKIWYGCDANSLVQGGAQNSTGLPKAPRCTSSYLHPDFARQLEKFFFKCLGRSARQAGLPEPAKVFAMHASTYRPNAMLHGTARAMDLTFVHFLDPFGRAYFTFSTHKPPARVVSAELQTYHQQNRIVYDSFRACWRENLPRRVCNPYTGGSIGYHGATPVAFNRADHNDHIHLELAPDCGPVPL